MVGNLYITAVDAADADTYICEAHFANDAVLTAASTLHVISELLLDLSSLCAVVQYCCCQTHTCVCVCVCVTLNVAICLESLEIVLGNTGNC